MTNRCWLIHITYLCILCTRSAFSTQRTNRELANELVLYMFSLSSLNEVMDTPLYVSSLFCLIFFTSILAGTSDSSTQSFLQCLTNNFNSNTSNPITNTLYSPKNSSYSSILESSIQNLLFISSATPKPRFIITPLHHSHIQSAVICSKRHGLLIRVRSGGHDYEGLSYLSDKPFIIIDLVKLNKITVDIRDETAWVQSGATLGEIYYHIAEKSSTHAFPAGICPTVGAGGYISGGGIGLLMRKYGLAADNIVDAQVVDVNGKFLDRQTMGEDLFWAIRGGGGASFGVIVSWKIKLVSVPSVVTVFNVYRTIEQGATNLFHKWQTASHKFPKELVIRTIVQPVNQATIQVQFQSQFLGGTDELLSVMATSFPELGVEAKDCSEMSWINATLYIAVLDGSMDILLDKAAAHTKKYFRGKSDFVEKALSVPELESIWKVMLRAERSPMMICEPLGGRMDEISESEIAFPHRVGNLYNIQYFIDWEDADGGLSASTKYLESTRRLYDYMTPFVSKSPRSSYINYKDLDLGVNKGVETSYREARVWGEKYFKDNYERLALVKNKVDPENFFWNEQSIPPLVSSGEKQRDPFIWTPVIRKFIDRIFSQ